MFPGAALHLALAAAPVLHWTAGPAWAGRYVPVYAFFRKKSFLNISGYIGKRRVAHQKQLFLLWCKNKGFQYLPESLYHCSFNGTIIANTFRCIERYDSQKGFGTARSDGSKGARTLGLPLVRRALIPAELCFHVNQYNTNIPNWEDGFFKYSAFLTCILTITLHFFIFHVKR